MTKYLRLFSSLYLIAFTSISCEKVIELDLEDSEPKLVVEANLKEGKEWFEVNISQTQAYFTNQSAQTIEGAVVRLKDDSGNTFTITDRGNGLYADSLIAQSNTLYTLSVEVDGMVYMAQSLLKPLVPIIEINTEFQEGFGPREAGYFASFTYQDPGNEENFYRAVYFIDGEKQTSGQSLIVLNDVLNNGNIPRINLVQERLQEGQDLRIELWHIDEASFDYFASLGDIIGAGQGPNQGSAAPGNPNSNWSGGILGYFTAYSASSQSKVVQ